MRVVASCLQVAYTNRTQSFNQKEETKNDKQDNQKSMQDFDVD